MAPLDTRPSLVDDFVVTKSEFIGLTKLNPRHLMFALIIHEVNKLESTIPDLVRPLIIEFQDVFPDEIPPGLPMMREIQHCIDFLPCSSIPNKPAYRINPTEFAKLHKQVNQLLEKGLIRESMSPCVVPALLVPKQVASFACVWTVGLLIKLLLNIVFPFPVLTT